MRVTCKHCGGAHPAFECRKKSTASGKDRIIVGMVRASKPNLRNVTEAVDAQPGKRNAIEVPAGIQALPVDTNSEAGYANVEHRVAPEVLPVSSPAPATKFDRKSWMREYQRNYMRNVYRPKLKAYKSQGETK